MTAPALIVAAPASNAGKTCVTLGMLAALRAKKVAVGAAKIGPDYIDPGFHAAATGRDCPNIDLFAMRLPTLLRAYDLAAHGAEMVLIEAVMGLFDGPEVGRGSSGDLAALLDLPVVLVVDARGVGASIAAVIEGFVRFDEAVRIDGLILNRVASARHERILRRAIEARSSTPILGCLPLDERLALPARHLGLVTAGEHPALASFLNGAAALVTEHLDLDRLQRLAQPPSVQQLGRAQPLPPLGQRIAVAQDAAFCFTYPHLLADWRRLGAEMLPFAPLNNEAPDKSADAVFLPGGYPELYAGRLQGNGGFLDGLREAAARGTALYGECGGYMVLGETLIDKQGMAHTMAGLLSVVSDFSQPTRHLGYRAMTTVHPSPLGPTGTGLRGHEFHYAREIERRGVPLFTAHDAAGRDLGPCGVVQGNVAGSFLHLIDREG